MAPSSDMVPLPSSAAATGCDAAGPAATTTVTERSGGGGSRNDRQCDSDRQAGVAPPPKLLHGPPPTSISIPRAAGEFGENVPRCASSKIRSIISNNTKTHRGGGDEGGRGGDAPVGGGSGGGAASSASDPQAGPAPAPLELKRTATASSKMAPFVPNSPRGLPATAPPSPVRAGPLDLRRAASADAVAAPAAAPPFGGLGGASDPRAQDGPADSSDNIFKHGAKTTTAADANSTDGGAAASADLNNFDPKFNSKNIEPISNGAADEIMAAPETDPADPEAVPADLSPAAQARDPHRDETQEDVSDISASSCEDDASADGGDGDGMAEGWIGPAAPAPALPPPEGLVGRRNRSFTIHTVLTNASEHGSLHGSVRSNRENVDRLLNMSAAGGSSIGGGSDVSPSHAARAGLRGCMELPDYSHTYDRDYYKAGDWLRFVPRRTSTGGSGGGGDQRSSVSSSEFTPPMHGGTGQGHPRPAANPDNYYRGFDNTRIRTGFSNFRHPGGAVAGTTTTSRVRQIGQLDPHPHHYPNHQMSGNFVGPNGEIIGAPSTTDANGNPEHRAPMGGNFVQYPPYAPQCQHPQMYPHMITVPIDEEEGMGGERESEHPSRPCSPPLEIHCSGDEKMSPSVPGHADQVEIQMIPPSSGLGQDVAVVVDSLPIAVIDPAAMDPRAGSPSASPSPPPPPDDGGGMHFESSLRAGGIVAPPPPKASVSTHGNGTGPRSSARTPLPPHVREQMMHEAAWDSKYETYACRVDQRQEDRSVEIPLFSHDRPHMRAFHFAWLTFFFAFLAWFAITPLLAEVQRSLDLTKEQLWTSSICSVAGAVVTRCMAGLFCDIYGARWMSAVVLFICGIPTIFTGFVNTGAGLSVLRLITGIGGSAFVTCQYWTCSFFTMEVAGTANALAAGWGNLGGGVAQVFVGSMLFPLFKWIYGAAGTERDPADLSWRTCCVIPGVLCTAFTFVVLRYSDDCPKGNYRKRKSLGLMQKPSAMKHLRAAVHDHNTWLLLIQYGCCFGVELTTTNAAALYFTEEFELSTEAAAAVASTFGWMNLFARGLGGFLSDISNAYMGMRGRLTWQLLCFLLEGVFVMVFSKAKTLGGAITALMTFSLFVQGAEGSTFGIVPYLNPSVTGTVAGIVGAGGNAGAVIFSIMFRQMEYREAFFWMGAATSAISLLSSLVWIKGYEGLFFRRRVIPVAQGSTNMANGESRASGKAPNTSELPAADEGVKNRSRSFVETETDPRSSISGPLSNQGS